MSEDRKNILVGAGTLKVDGVEIGFTEGGVTLSLEKEFYDVEADQETGILDKKETRQVCSIVTNLLEATLENIKIVWGIESPIETPSGKKVLSFGGLSGLCSSPQEHGLEFNGCAPNKKQRKFVVYRAVSVETGEHSYLKGEKTVIPVTFQCLMDTDKPKGRRYGYYEDVV
jgi:hypothetical protein